MSGLRFACVAAIAAMLTGCMVGPNYERAETVLPPAYPEPPIATTPTSGAAVVRPDWWVLYGDATLDRLVTTALSDNLDVAVAVARIEEADALLREVNASLFPEIDLGATAARSRTSNAVAVPSSVRISNDIRIALSTSFEIDFWGRLRRLVESARAQALGTHYARDVVTLSIAGLTTQTYFSLRSLDAQITATRETLATRDDYYAIVQRRSAAGLASDLEVNQALGVRADAAAQLKEFLRQRSLVEHLLGTLTGDLSLTIPPGDLAQLPVPPMPPPGLPSLLLERRPDVRVAEENLVAANAQIGAAKAALFPRIALTGALGTESDNLATLLSTGGRIWSIGFGLALPIFTAGRLNAEVDATVARERQAVANYQKSIQTAFREVADALTNIASASATQSDLQTSVDAATNALRLATRRYEVGYAPYLDILDAQRSLNIAQLALIRNRQALLSATVDLMKALGGGWKDAEPLATVNGVRAN